MDNKQKKAELEWSYIIASLLLVALAIVIVWFVFDIKDILQSGVAGSGITRMHRRSEQRPQITIQQIEDWMTFRYINYAFNLPSDYLASKLKITDANYPKITLSKYASSQKLNSLNFTESVRQAVTEYQNGGH